MKSTINRIEWETEYLKSDSEKCDAIDVPDKMSKIRQASLVETSIWWISSNNYICGEMLGLWPVPDCTNITAQASINVLKICMMQSSSQDGVIIYNNVPSHSNEKTNEHQHKISKTPG